MEEQKSESNQPKEEKTSPLKESPVPQEQPQPTIPKKEPKPSTVPKKRFIPEQQKALPPPAPKPKRRSPPKKNPKTEVETEEKNTVATLAIVMATIFGFLGYYFYGSSPSPSKAPEPEKPLTMDDLRNKVYEL